MRIVLIHPPPQAEFDKHWARFPVLGLAYIAASLRKAGHEVVLLDGKLGGLDQAHICRKTVQADAGLIGITSMTVEFPMAAAIATTLKQYVKTPIILGGAHINAMNQQPLEEVEAFDYGCVGEGEFLICELAEALQGRGDVAAIPGLVRREGGKVVVNCVRPYPQDYDSIPFAAWDLFKRTEEVPILTHRGCPFQCVFCGHNSGFKPRYRSTENVIEEMKEIIACYSPKVIRIEDETFGLNMNRTKRILQGILDEGLHKRVAFSAQTRVDRVDERFITLLKAANFMTLELGVESGNPEVLARIKKGITLDQVERAVRLAKGAGLRVWCKFILGHPHETHVTIRDTIACAARLNPDQLSVSIMTPFPGTPIHDMAREGRGGYRMLSDDWRDFDKYSTGALELEEVSLTSLKIYQIGCYLYMYLRNWRMRELCTLAWHHRRMAVEMLASTLAQAFTQVFGKRGTRFQGSGPSAVQRINVSRLLNTQELPTNRSVNK